MKICAVMMVKDEADIIGYTMRYLLTQEIDAILVSDNNSSDKTMDILRDIKRISPIPVEIRTDTEVAYFQSKKMTALAHEAASLFDPEWILPLDADELVYSLDGRTIGAVLRSVENEIINMPWWFYYSTVLDNPLEKNPYLRIKWRIVDQSVLGKACYRYKSDLVIAQGNHNVLNEHGCPVWGGQSSLHVKHFPHRSVKQFVRKIINGGKAYEVAGDKIPESFGAAWRLYYKHYLANGVEGLKDHYMRHFVIKDPENDPQYVHDPANYKEYNPCTE
jgi:glycosyltransferase involved in cell wall biosynthesis